MPYYGEKNIPQENIREVKTKVASIADITGWNIISRTQALDVQRYGIEDNRKGFYLV
jgi:hypothetical protein